MANNSPDSIIGKYSLADFRMWSIMALKGFISPRKKSFKVLAAA